MSRICIHSVSILLCRKRVIICIFFLAAAYHVNSQITDPLPETDIRPVAFSGSLGFLSEAYAVSGIDPRRPPAMGQLMLNTNFSLFGLRSGFNMVYSTDDNPLRQSMNRFYYSGSWRWLSLSAGDVAPVFSRYSLSGVTVRGGMIEVNPGNLSLSATAGRTKRKVVFTDEPGFREPSFEQWLYGARIGMGSRGRTQFALSGVYVYDVESLAGDWGNASPAENLSLTPEFNLSLLNGSIYLTSNFTLSFFSSDVTSEELDLAGIPGVEFLAGIFTPRASSRVDYAGEVSALVHAGPLSITGGYERVQPGFMSLGLGQVRSDQEMFRFRPQARLMNGRINLGAGYTRGRNNLMETRISTVERQQINTNANIRITPSANLTLSYMHMQNENIPVDMNIQGATDMHQKQVSRNFIIVPTLVIRSGAMAHSFSVNTSYQILDDRSYAVSEGARIPLDFTNFSSGVSYGTSFPKGVSFSASGNLMRNVMNSSESTGYSLNASTGYSFFDRKLSTNLSLGWSQNGIEYVQVVDPDDPFTQSQYIKRLNQQLAGNNGIIEGEYVVRQWSRQFMVNMSASYRLPNGNPLRLMLRGLINNPGGNGGQAYDEMFATLRYDHRF